MNANRSENIGTNTNEQGKHMARINQYKHIRVPADLRDQLKQEANETNRKLHETALDFFDEILDDQWCERNHGTVHIAVYLEPEKLNRLKNMAAKCNLSLTSYVKAYHERRKMLNTQQ